MKLFIPTIGTLLELRKQWSFGLYNEYRNESYFAWAGLHFLSYAETRDLPVGSFDKNGDLPPTIVTLPSLSRLRVDRIYIRKGVGEFDSVTFLLQGAKTASKVEKRTYRVVKGLGQHENHEYERKIPARGVRFWAKLDDVNNMDVLVVPVAAKT